MRSASVIIFGATGTIGQAICDWFLGNDYDVIAITRTENTSKHASSRIRFLSWDASDAAEGGLSKLDEQSINAVVWAQGANFNDDISSFELKAHSELYAANVTYILIGLQVVLRQNILAPAARLCVISSIWQNIARPNKLSYCITKSAIQGLVQSLSIDLGTSGYLINAVLPGALDTPMTRSNLNDEQIQRIQMMTPLGSLPLLHDVCNLVGFLCSTANTGITGQFIAADRGFSYARII